MSHIQKKWPGSGDTDTGVEVKANANKSKDDDMECQGQSQCEGQPSNSTLEISTMSSISSKFRQDSVENVNYMKMPSFCNSRLQGQGQGLSDEGPPYLLPPAHPQGSKQNSRTVLKVSPGMHSIATPNLSVSDLKILGKMAPPPGPAGNSNLLLSPTGAGAGTGTTKAITRTSKLESLTLPQFHYYNRGQGQGQGQTGRTSDSNNSFTDSSSSSISNTKFDSSSSYDCDWHAICNDKGFASDSSHSVLLSELNSPDSFDSFSISGQTNSSKNSFKRDTMSIKSCSSQYLSTTSSSSSSTSGNSSNHSHSHPSAGLESKNGANFSNDDFVKYSNSSGVNSLNLNCGGPGFLKLQRSSSAHCDQKHHQQRHQPSPCLSPKLRNLTTARVIQPEPEIENSDSEI